MTHAPYSPDLNPSDFILFPNHKKCLAGKQYGFDSEVITTMNAGRIRTLKQRWVTQCISLQGDRKNKVNSRHNFCILLFRPETFHPILVSLCYILFYKFFFWKTAKNYFHDEAAIFHIKTFGR